MKRRTDKLERLLHLKRQTVRMADAECLRARVAWDAARADCAEWQRRIETLSEECAELLFRAACGARRASPAAERRGRTPTNSEMQHSASPASQFESAQRVAVHLDGKWRQARETVEETHRCWIEAADRRRTLQHEIEALERLLATQREAERRLREKRTEQQVEANVLRSRGRNTFPSDAPMTT